MKGDMRKERLKAQMENIKIAKEIKAKGLATKIDKPNTEPIGVVTGSQRDFIQLQHDYHKAFLVVQLKDVTLNDLKEKLESYVEGHDQFNVTHGTEKPFNERMTVEWDGSWKTYRRLAAEYNYDCFQFNLDMQSMLKMRTRLTKFNVTDDDVQNILKGKYIKEDRKYV